MDDLERREIRVLVKKFSLDHAADDVLRAVTRKGAIHKQTFRVLSTQVEQLREALKDYE